MKTTIIALFLFASLLISCDTDESDGIPPEDEGVAFYALNVGNYWTYKNYAREANSSEFQLLDCTTTVEIIGTTSFNGETYYTFETTNTGSESNSAPCSFDEQPIRHLRDSLGYLIDTEGAVLYSRESTAPYLISTNEWGDVYGELVSLQFSIEVEAGTFECANLKRFAILSDGTISQGEEQVLWSAGIGKIYETYSSVNNQNHRWDRRLSTYSVSNDSTN